MDKFQYLFITFVTISIILLIVIASFGAIKYKYCFLECLKCKEKCYSLSIIQENYDICIEQCEIKESICKIKD